MQWLRTDPSGLVRLGGIQEKIVFRNSSENRFFWVYVPALQYLRNIPEVGAYNSSWKESYEHRRKNIFVVVVLPFSPVFIVIVV